MIQIVRKIRMDDIRPAGLVFIENSAEEVKNACSFLWGRDISCYEVYVNGFVANISSAELGEIEKEINKYYW